ncbi:NYN domain-containing protein [Methanocalculus sp.]|uniref:NYN domain-containing protein n=1 Tax=Methanocalculus sp. TaxID=2004547 RepID=UPI002718FE4F|nr:NYN domain-containing protein [Methanocalculus sp.]MDO8841360.1 NYN domain-containing protein [Methanocalculus sp.]
MENKQFTEERDLFCAIYLDYENLAISAEQSYPALEGPLSLGPIIDYAASLGDICIRKAYADWSTGECAADVKKLVKYGFEMRHLPQTSARGKNGADMDMALDVLEDMILLPHIGLFIIGSGDTDFIPLIRRLRARGKMVYVMGFDSSVGSVIKENCTKYQSLDELLCLSPTAAGSDPVSDDDSAIIEEDRIAARDLVIRFVRTRTDEGPVFLSDLKNQLIRINPSFSEKKLGFSSFKKFIGSLEGDVVLGIITDRRTGHPLVTFRDLDEIDPVKVDANNCLATCLNSRLRFIGDRAVRTRIFELILLLFQDRRPRSIHEMAAAIYPKIDQSVSKATLNRVLFGLGGEGRVFRYYRKDPMVPPIDSPQVLNESVRTVADIETVYLASAREAVKRIFPDMDDADVERVVR